eukprot:3696250-Rhodomonas_salina.1
MDGQHILLASIYMRQYRPLASHGKFVGKQRPHRWSLAGCFGLRDRFHGGLCCILPGTATGVVSVGHRRDGWRRLLGSVPA